VKLDCNTITAFQVDDATAKEIEGGAETCEICETCQLECEVICPICETCQSPCELDPQ